MQHRDIGRNLLHGLHRHLDFARGLELVLGRNNGGNDLSFSPLYSFCHNMPLSVICDDMRIRSARVSVRITVGLVFARCSSPFLDVLVQFLLFTVRIFLDLLL